MALSSLTYIAGISVLFIFQLIYNDYERKKITSKPSAKKFEMKWSLVEPLSKLCVTPPFSINSNWEPDDWLQGPGSL